MGDCTETWHGEMQMKMAETAMRYAEKSSTQDRSRSSIAWSEGGLLTDPKNSHAILPKSQQNA